MPDVIERPDIPLWGKNSSEKCNVINTWPKLKPGHSATWKCIIYLPIRLNLVQENSQMNKSILLLFVVKIRYYQTMSCSRNVNTCRCEYTFSPKHRESKFSQNTWRSQSSCSEKMTRDIPDWSLSKMIKYTSHQGRLTGVQSCRTRTRIPDISTGRYTHE